MEIDIEQYYDKIYRYCYFKVNHKSLAEDLTQETFLRFLHSEDQVSVTAPGQGPGSDPVRYLYTIAKHLCIDAYRASKRYEEYPEEEPSEESFEDSLIMRMDLKEALDRLPEEEKEILTLRYAGDVRVNEISKLMGISRFAVHRKLKQAKDDLQRLLERRKDER